MRKVWFCSTGISSFLITCVGVKAYSVSWSWLEEFTAGSCVANCVANCEKLEVLFGFWLFNVARYGETQVEMGG
jgi:hypothetical protein